MSVKVYQYNRCGTCVKAVKFLEAHNIAFESIPVREQPPTKKEILNMLDIYEGNIKKLFNTSGQDYRAQGLGKKLPEMTEEAQVQLLLENGNLVKRPFVVTSDSGIVGFKEDAWKELFKV